jgi:hypothetical protein
MRATTGRSSIFSFIIADFVREMVNVLYPGAIHRSVLFDVGLTTPKQLAAELHHYAKKHPELEFKVDVIPQVAGTIPRSTQICGVTACLAFRRPYIYPLTLLQPFGVATTAAVGFCDRRYNVQHAIGKAPRIELGAPSLSDGHALLPVDTVVHEASSMLE